jgi:phage terminase large subunit
LKRIVNPNLSFLCKNIKFERRSELLKLYEKKQITFEQFKQICLDENIPSGALLEGSSRSGKTISSIDFKVWLASKKKEKATVNVIRETYNSFKTTLNDDYDRRLKAFDVYSPFWKQEVATFKIYDLKVNLLGADSADKFLGAGSDYVYFNEMLDIPKEVVDQAVMRCRKFWWGDFNPKYADHHVFNSILPQKDVAHIRTTYNDNPFISPNERIKIESYQPVEASAIAIFLCAPNPKNTDQENESKRIAGIQKALQYDCEKNPAGYPPADIAELKRCQYNERVGTADAYKWAVFGRGERRAPEGLIFPKVRWVKEIPANCEKIGYGLDFGYTESPSCLVKWGLMGTDIYAQILFYQPTPSPNDLLPLLAKFVTPQDLVWADPSGDNGGRGMITACRNAGYSVYAANTFPGSIQYGISILKKFNINLIDGKEWRKEQMGYTKATAKVNGIKVTLDEPIDANNHAWDALRISALMNRL